jgi:hypothetical protein
MMRVKVDDVDLCIYGCAISAAISTGVNRVAR